MNKMEIEFDEEVGGVLNVLQCNVHRVSGDLWARLWIGCVVEHPTIVGNYGVPNPQRTP